MDAGADERLDSWKEIAAYLGHAVRTVKRWEKDEGLPVHRHLHRRLGTVYGYKAEVDAWRKTRELRPDRDLEPEVSASQTPASEVRPRRGRLMAALAIALVALTGVSYWYWPRGGTEVLVPGRRLMLAVLPFENLSGDPDQEFFSDGLTEEMIAELGQLDHKRLGVIARTSSMSYKGTKKNIAQVASELGVDYLLEGSVRREGARVRISAQLIDARDQTHLWAESFDREVGGIADVQSQVARAIAGRIQLELDPNRQLFARTRSIDPEAYEASLRGRYFLERRTAADLGKAQVLFERAIARAPDYALAHVGLADAYILSTTYADAPAVEMMAKARQAVSTALALDDTLPAAHAWSGIIRSEYDWDWTGAAHELRRAIELDPNFAYGHKLYAEYLSYVGRFDEAVREARLARRLDPVSVVTNSLVGVVLYRARRYDEALAELKQATELDPTHPMPYLPLGLAYSMKGMHAEAVAALEKSLALAPESSEIVAQLAHVYGRGGEAHRARSSLQVLRQRSAHQHVSAFFIALAHVGLGDTDAAVESLERAYEARDWYICLLKTEPILDPLRRDRRFQELLERVNFPS